MARDSVWNSVVKVHVLHRNLVEAQQPKLNEILVTNTENGQINWKAVSADFQAFVDDLLSKF